MGAGVPVLLEEGAEGGADVVGEDAVVEGGGTGGAGLVLWSGLLPKRDLIEFVCLKPSRDLILGRNGPAGADSAGGREGAISGLSLPYSSLPTGEPR